MAAKQGCPLLTSQIAASLPSLYLKKIFMPFLFQSLNLHTLWGHEAIWACFNITVAGMLMVVLHESRQIAPKHLTSSKLAYAELLQLNWNPKKKKKKISIFFPCKNKMEKMEKYP